MSEATQEPPVLKIQQKDAHRALAIFAHLRQILTTAVHRGQYVRPVDMDQASILLSAASLRALFFDDKPILPTFMHDHGIVLEIETFATNLNLLLLSQLAPSPTHVSDFLMELNLVPALKKVHPLGQPREIIYAFQSPKGFEGPIAFPEIWVPTQAEEGQINSGVGLASNGGLSQLALVTRQQIALTAWGGVQIGYLKAIRIDRRNLISYVANKLGGVHYDSDRHPAHEADARQFKVMATAYDWNNQAIMHAGLVATALACVEIANCVPLAQLYTALGNFCQARQERLWNVEPYALQS